MRKFLVLFIALSIFAIGNLFGQTNFFDQSTHFYYNNFAPEIWPVKVDSLISENGNQTLYFNEGMISVHGYECLDTAGPSIVGPKVTRLFNGNYLFYNRYGDSIPIYMDASVGDNWVCYQDSNISVSVVVESIQNQTFDGVEDEVHSFRFNVDSQKSDYRSVDNHYIKIGSNVGVIRNLSWVAFPYIHYRLNINDRVPSSEFPNGIYPDFDDLINVSKADLFNFKIGDKYHIEYKEWHGTPFVYDKVLTKLEVVDRIDEANQITLIYKRERQVGTDSIYIDSVDNPHFFYIYEDIVHDTLESIYSKAPDALYGNPMTFNNESANVMVKKYNKPAFIPNYLIVYPISDSCARFDELFYPTENYYVLGLGGPYYSYHDNISGIVTRQRRIRYYDIEGEISYGSPIEFVGVESLSARNNFNIYPNPVSNKLFVDFAYSVGPVNYAIFDICGRKVLERKLVTDNSKFFIDVSAFTKGMYIIKMTFDGNQNMAKRFIKK